MKKFNDTFEITLDSVGKGFTLIPIGKENKELYMSEDGIIFDGILYLWEEIKLFKIRRKNNEKS